MTDAGLARLLPLTIATPITAAAVAPLVARVSKRASIAVCLAATAAAGVLLMLMAPTVCAVQRYRWHHTYVEKTTLYLPEDLKAAVRRAAAERGVSKAEIIRESIRVSVGSVRPSPRGALYSSGQPIARYSEELLVGFGDR